MRKSLKKRMENRSGFTLAEVLMAVLILAMVAGIVAAGVPAAVRAYRSVKDAGNADVLLSTTMTRLRDELGTADILSVDGTTVTYTASTGTRSVLSLVTTGTSPGIWLQEYDDVVTDPTERAKYYRRLVSREASNGDLYVTYALNAGAWTGRTLTFSDLTVYKLTDEGSEQLYKIDELKIRLSADRDTE